MKHKLKLAVEKLYAVKSFFYRPAFFVFFIILTVLLFVFVIMADAKIKHTALKVQTKKFNRSIIFQQDNLIQNTKQLLFTLSKMSQVKNGPITDCNSVLANILSKNKNFVNIASTDRDGNIVCSAVTLSKPVNSADRTWFRETKETKDFSAGDYVIGRISDKPTITYGYPILDDLGNFDGVITASLDLALYDRMIQWEPPPEGVDVIIFDHNSSIVYSYPQSELTERSIADFKIFKRALTSKSGIIDADGLDGVERTYSYAPLGLEDSGLFIAVGSERNSGFSAIINVITPRSSWLTVISLAVVFLIWADIYFLVYFIRKTKGK